MEPSIENVSIDHPLARADAGAIAAEIVGRTPGSTPLD